ncbi:related to multidrug resistant protein [Melanopsichium pennsylvanicum]|uniref:Related to multidrug resistant protein n=1 Tax=Melanopsichium pennsylvanicum TaxID=63383 RepID=A0AAJ4XUK9_9BASI|nr:related to multidrug resistant protein [Melanopsichium pennsylvanicum]
MATTPTIPTLSPPLPTLSRHQTETHNRLAQDTLISCNPLATPSSLPLLPLTAQEIESIQLIGAEDSRSWSHAKKWTTTVIISLMGFISPLGSSILIPGTGFVDRSFSLDSRTLSILPVSVFVVGLGIGPFILAPCSETVGRQPVYVVTSLIFVAFNLASAFSPNFVGLNVLRLFAGAAGSTGPSLGAGSIGDMFSPSQRGRAQSLYGLGPLMGPVFGSIVGCFIAAATKDWRWLLHTLTILSAVVFIITVLFLDETYTPVLLGKKREKAIQTRLLEIKQQQQQQHLITQSLIIFLKPTFLTKFTNITRKFWPCKNTVHKIKMAQSRPFRLLFTNPICAIFSYYLGFCYGIVYLFITQHPLLFQTRKDEPDAPSAQVLPTYNWSLGISGLSYLGLGLGFLVAAFTNAFLQDEIYARLVIADGRLGWWLFKSQQEIQSIIQMDSSKNKNNKKKVASNARDDVEKVQQFPLNGSIGNHNHSKEIGNNDANSSFGNVTPVFNPDMATTIDTQTYTRKVDEEQVEPSTTLVSHSLASTPITSMTTIKASQAAIVQTKKGRPEYRLPLCFIGMLILPIGLLLFGWSAEYQTHFMIPLIGSFFVGCSTILCFQTILVYLVDTFVPYSASATACAVLIRSILAAAFPLFAEFMFQDLGYGKSCTLLAGIGLVGLPVPLVLYRYGETLRNRFQFNG